MGSIRFVSDLASIKIRNLENKIDKVWRDTSKLLAGCID